jgi:hypothetical protein
MKIPHERVRIFYHGKSAFAFKKKMEEYRKKYELPDAYSPKIKVEDNEKKGVKVDPNKYTVTYYEYDYKQLRPDPVIHKVIVHAKLCADAHEAFQRMTKNNPDTAYIRAHKVGVVPKSNLSEWVVEWRTAIKRRHKFKKRD